jgi:pimeloyl-ACP methyl ester carboxylesterase
VLEEFRRQSVPFEGQGDSERVTGVTFGSGAPLYVLGPAAGDRELFALLAWLLKDDFCCVFVDRPAIGWPVNATIELPRLTRSVLSAAHRLDHQRFAVLGVEFGSALALDLAVNNPEQISSLVLLQAAPRVSPSWLERGLHTYGSGMPGLIGGIPGWWNLQQQNHRPWFPPFDGSRFDFLVQNLGQTPTAQFSRCMRLWTGLDFGAHLKSIVAPTLLIETEGEGANINRQMRDLQAALKDARTEDMHSSGLYPYLTHPHRVAKLMRTFLCGELAPRVP